MAEIRPFRGLHYNPAMVKDLSKVICPPYDIISPQLQQELYQRSDFNFVRVEYGRELPQDKATFNKYTRAAATAKDWLEQQVLTIDEKPALYLDEHTFTCHGRTLHRSSITCLVKLEDWSKMVIRPHEGTLHRAKSDRLNMLWALESNTSPVMSLYEGNTTIASTLKEQKRHKPSLRVSHADGESHRIWAVTDDNTIEKLKGHLARQPLYIADGHHRYESALTYQRERRSSSPVPTGESSFDFVMMTLVDITDPGLVILPAHRLIRGMEQSAFNSLLSRLSSFFAVEDHAIDKKDIRSQIDTLLSKDKGETRLLLCGLKPVKIQSISVSDFGAIQPMFPAFHSDYYQKLDVSIVDHVILEELLGLSHDKAGAFLDYNYDAAAAVKKVLEKEYQLGIIVNPVKPEAIKTIADSGDRMPRKSTYFYPKAPAGLITYRFA